MSTEIITLIMFLSLIVLLISGFPIAFSLAGLAVLGIIFFWDPASLLLIAITTLRTSTSFILIAVPMFIFMANILERSKLADDLYDVMSQWFASWKGGLAIGTVLICALMSAMTGISGPATVTMGLIALPSMVSRKYDKRLAIGVVAAGGALGILIPPSVTFVIWGLFAQVSIGKLFLGGIIPGLLLVALFIIYIVIKCTIYPQDGPPLDPSERVNLKEKLLSLKRVILPLLLIVLVLGTIFGGVASVTEGSAIGAFGSIICAAINRRLTWQVFQEACQRTLNLTVMVMWICIGAACFTAFYNAIGAPDMIIKIVQAFPVNKWAILVGMQLTYFILGTMLDPMGIIMITTPVFIPLVKSLGFDEIWFGVLFVMNMEMAYITPPFGYNLFYMKGMNLKGITMVDIYSSVLPFVLLQAIGLILVMVFPQIALWLPNLIF